MILLVTVSFFLCGVLGDSIPFANSGTEKRHEMRKRVVGGELTEIHMHPWLASIYIKDEFLCSGSIISESVILTAAHCMADRSVAYSVRVGSSEINSKGFEHQVVAIKRHENFEFTTHRYTFNDLALMKVSPPFELSGDVMKVHLARIGDEVVSGTVASFAGWGRTSNGGTISPMLKNTSLIIIGIAECSWIYEQSFGEEVVSKKQICAAAPGRGVCHGDSGGPLMVGGVQVGIASWGVGCALLHPGVFVNVAHYRDWIDKNLQILDPPKTENLRPKQTPISNSENPLSIQASNLKMYGPWSWSSLILR